MAKARDCTKPYTKQDHLTSENKNQSQSTHNKPAAEKQASWAVVKSLITCKHLQVQQLPCSSTVQQLKQQKLQELSVKGTTTKSHKKLRCSASLCSISNTKAIHMPQSLSPQHHKENKNKNKNKNGDKSMKTDVIKSNGVVGVFSSPSNINGSSKGKGIPFMKLTGCYECRMVVDPVLGFSKQDSSSLRSTICSCNECGEIFMKAESLELHSAVSHAVCELGPEDSSKNIVEIIFQSSWLRKQKQSSPMICKIERILKVQNSQKTISRFEEYRDAIKTKATKLPNKKLHPRCIADGNELLRFHCTTFICSLGLNGSSNLCSSIPHCKACSIIKNGFRSARAGNGGGILTTATSGKAHERAFGIREEEDGGAKRAMLVCRVIAGRVKKNTEGGGGGGGGLEEYDSVVGAMDVYSNPDELYVFNPRAILPCFVVIYGGF